MDWIKQSLILLVFAFGLLEFCSGDADSKLQTAQQFEQCVVGNISESTVLSEEDLLRVYKIVLETGVRMQKLRADPTNATNTRTMLRLFTAALAYLVSESDPANRCEREEACISALEACSGLLPELIGSELVNEIRKIFESMDRGKPMETSGENSRRKIPAFSEHEEQHFEESTEKIPSNDFKTKTRSKRAFPSVFRYPDTTIQFQSNPSFESVIANVLLKSTSFTDTFNIGLSQSDAIFYAGGMITASLAGYSYDIIDEALNSVTKAVSTIRFMPGSEDYAVAIARPISSVLRSRGLLPFADAVIIGNALVFKLDSMLETNPSIPSPNFSMQIPNSGWGTAGATGSVQSGAAAPVQENPDFIAPSFTAFNFKNDNAQFQNSLSYFLSQSGAISTAFCSGSIPNLFNVISSALSDYGFLISSTAATVISDSFSGLPDAAACTQYADVISEIISNIFQNNGLLQTADPQAIANQIAFNINSNSGVGNNPSQNPQNFGPQEFGSFQLNPSFSDFTFPAMPVPPLNPEISSAGIPSAEISSSVPNIQLDEQQNPAPSADQVYPAELQSSGVQPLPPFPVIETPVHPQVSVDQPIPITSDKEEVTDYKSELPQSEVQFSSQQSHQGLGKSISSSTDASSPVLQSSSSLNSPRITNQTLEIKSVPPVISASIAMDRLNQSSFPLLTPPIALEPGPFISGNSTVNIERKSEVKNINVTPAVVEETKEPEITTVAPTSTDGPHSTPFSILETTTTSDPYEDALDDILLDPGKFSDLLTADINKSLKSMNLTSTKEEKQSTLPKATIDGETIAEPLTNSEVPSEPERNAEGKINVDDTNLKVETSTSKKASSGNGDKDSAKLEKKVFEIDTSVRDSIAEISPIAVASIDFIKSERFHLNGLCVRLNELALIVDIPPLDYCSELATVDYLLNVLNAVALAVTG